MSEATLPATGMCTNKVRHATGGAARTELRRLQRRSYVRAAQRLEAYRCPQCTFWHIGHRPVRGQ